MKRDNIIILTYLEDYYPDQYREILELIQREREEAQESLRTRRMNQFSQSLRSSRRMNSKKYDPEQLLRLINEMYLLINWTPVEFELELELCEE